MLLGGEEKPTLVQNLQVLSPFSYFCPVDVSAKKSVMGNQENRHQFHRKHWLFILINMLYCVGHGSIHLRQLKSVEEGTIQVQLKNFVWFLENIFFYNLSVQIILNDFI